MIRLGTIVLLLWALAAGAGGLTEEPIGPYFVNLGIIERGTGRVLDEVFPAEVRPLRINTAALLARVQRFRFYTGTTYRFLQRGVDWRLFKFEPGRRPLDIRLYGLVFPPAMQPRILLQLRRAAPIAFSQYELGQELELLGVLGIADSGGQSDIDFVEAWAPAIPPESGQAFPSVLLANADAALQRFAFDNWLAARPMVHFTGDDRAPMPEDPTGKRKFLRALMTRLGPGQEMLDLCLNNPNEGIFLSAEDRRIPTALQVGGTTLFLSELPILFRYLPCRAGGDSGFGSAKACFVPVKIAATVEGHPKEGYPIYVFPAAFTTVYGLVDALKRELYHAQWWNAVATLPVDHAGQKRVREFLLRTHHVLYEKEIFAAINGGKTEVVTFEADQAAFNFEMRKLFLLAIERGRASPTALEAPGVLPWTAELRLLAPWDAQPVAQDNRAIQPADRDQFTAHQPQFEFVQRGSACYSLAVGEAAPPRRQAGDSFLPLARVHAGTKLESGAPQRLPDAAGRRFYELLRQAVTYNYTMSRQLRSIGLAHALETLKTTITTMLPPADGREVDFALLDGVRTVGFQYHDMMWLAEITAILDCRGGADEGRYQGCFGIAPLTAHNLDHARGANRLMTADSDEVLIDFLDRVANQFHAGRYEMPWPPIVPYLDTTTQLYHDLTAAMAADQRQRFDAARTEVLTIKALCDDLKARYVALVGPVQGDQSHATVRNNDRNNIRGRYRDAYATWDRNANPLEPDNVRVAREEYQTRMREFLECLDRQMQVIPNRAMALAQTMYGNCPAQGFDTAKGAIRQFQTCACNADMTALRSTQTRPTLTWRQSVAEWLLFNQGNPNSNAARSLWNEMVSNYWNPPPNEQTNPFEFYDENGTVFQGTTGRY